MIILRWIKNLFIICFIYCIMIVLGILSLFDRDTDGIHWHCLSETKEEFESKERMYDRVDMIIDNIKRSSGIYY